MPTKHEIDLFDELVRSDPYSYYRTLRESRPVCMMSPGNWIITAYSPCAEVLRDTRFERWDFGNERSLHPNGFWAITSKWLMLLAPGRDSKLRSSVEACFRQFDQVVALHRVNDTINRSFEGAASQPVIDVINAIAKPATATFAAELFAIPDEEKDLIASALEDPYALAYKLGTSQAPSKLQNCISRLANDRKASGGTDLISAITLAAAASDDQISEQDVFGFCILFLIAATDNLTNFIGNAILALSRFPEEHQKLRSDKSVLSSAVEELLRFDPPIQFVRLIARHDHAVCDEQIRKGDFVLACIAAANRDPFKFPDPDSLNLGRGCNPHLSFGNGPFSCIGSSMARRYGANIINSIAQRFCQLQIDTTPLTWKRSPPISRGLTALPLRISIP